VQGHRVILLFAKNLPTKSGCAKGLYTITSSIKRGEKGVKESDQEYETTEKNLKGAEKSGTPEGRSGNALQGKKRHHRRSKKPGKTVSGATKETGGS